MNREALKEILPHREPMLLLDEAEESGGIAKGKYTVRGDEWFLQGHFPGNPVVPGVILCEMMAQSACVLLEKAVSESTPYFTGLNKVRFKHPVLPGDTIVFKSQITAQKNCFYFGKGEGYVDAKLCISGEFSFALRNNHAMRKFNKEA